MIATGGTILALILLAVEGQPIGFAPKILFTAFILLITNPTASHAIANAAYRLELWPTVVQNEREESK